MKSVTPISNIRYLLIFGSIFLFSPKAFAQPCDASVPTFNVDLSAAPFMTWVSPSTDRDGYCCGASGPDNCLEFVITLHPDAAAIVFSIASGAVPPGALFYQVNCGPPTAVGSPICLTGAGPFRLTFCKPGGNRNTFSIETIPNPIFGPNITLGSGCTGELAVRFYDESTVTWNSIAPGTSGQYNGLLSCTSGCDTVTVTSNPTVPPFVNYLVCGLSQNGCIVTPICDTMRVTFFPPLTVNITATDSVLCYNETTLPVSGTITGGTAPYTVSWSNGATTLATNLGLGTHTLSVTDANNCFVYQDQITITQLSTPVVTAGPDIVYCANATGGFNLSGSTSNVSAVIWTGGAGTYSPNNTSTSTTYTPTAGEIASGSLTLTLQSNNGDGCTPASDNVTITFPPVASSITFTTVNVTCFGSANGSVSVNVVGSGSPYTYSYDGGSFTASSTQGSLAAGSHTVTVRNTFGCQSTLTFTITQPAALTVAETAHQNVLCSGLATGSSTVAPSGGTPSYSYSWNTVPVQTTATASNLLAGTYTVQVIDANGCIVTLSPVITQPTPVVLSLIPANPLCAGSSNGTISSSISGGVAPYTYNWSTGATTASVSGLMAGSYSLTATDANGCSIAQSITLTNPTPLALSMSPNATVCPGVATTISGTVSGGTGAYTYVWTPAAGNVSSISVSPVATTTYLLSVSDVNGCSISGSTTLSTVPPLTISLVAPDTILCYNETTLPASVTISGGIAPYSVSWTNGSTTLSTNLAVGTHTVSVTDAFNCVVYQDQVQIIQLPTPVVSAGPDIVYCANATGGFSLSGTSSNVSAVVWSGGAGTYTPNNTTLNATYTPTASEIASGSLTLTLQSNNGDGCLPVSDNVSITFPVVASSITLSTVNVTCFGLANGSVSVNVVGAGNPYTFSFDGGSFNTTSTQGSLAPGSHTVVVNNTFGCQSTLTFTITQPAVLTVAETAHQNVLCSGLSTGSSTVAPSGGTPSYTYSWNSTPVQTTATASNLAVGSYTVQVTDANGCLVSLNTTITQPAALVLALNPTNPLCTSAANGTISSTVSGGVAPYTYNWSTGATTASVSGLVAGNYTLTATDANGCSISQSISLVDPMPLILSMSPNTTACPGTSSTITGTVSGGTGAYTYVWTPAAGNVSSISVSPVATTTYNLSVTDANGCSISGSTMISTVPPMTIALVAPDTILCFNETTLPGSVTISGGIAPYNVSWTNGSTSLSTDLAVGSHTVTVTDAYSCVVYQDQVQIVQLPMPEVDAGGNVVSCANYIGAITLNGSSLNTSAVVWIGGAGTFSPNNTTETVDYTPTPGEIAAGSLGLTLQSNDASGCPSVSENMVITFPVVSTSVFIQTTNVTCFGLADGTAEVGVLGPNGPYSFSFDGGPYSTNETQNSIAAGTHTVNVMNNFGCDSMITFVITEPTPLAISESAHDNVDCFGASTGNSTVLVSGGVSPYTYSWNSSPVQTSEAAANLPVGTYAVQVTDANGCLIGLSTTITQPTPISIVLNVVPPTCFGLSNGAVSSTVTGGVAPYTYLWSNSAISTSINNITAGSYTLTVQDENRCPMALSTVVSQPAELVMSMTNDTVVCPNSSVTITGSATGGTGTYTYAWTPASENTNSVTVTPTGDVTYSLTITDNNGCSIQNSTAINTISFNPGDLAATISKDSICLNDSTGINAIYLGSDPSVTLSWNHCPTCPINTSVSPATDQVYTVTATNQCGQQITDQVTLVIVAPPIVELLTNLGSVCPNEFFSVANQGTNNREWSYFWNFGDGGTSNDMVGIHSYPTPGVYTISLYVVNTFGCTSADTATGQITVNPQAVADFSTNSLEQTTLDPQFNFYNQSINASNYLWNFGDGESSTLTNPVHIYEGYGYFTITLNANNEFNCPDQTQIVVEIKPSFSVYIPNAFTPDGIGVNNVFQVESYGISESDFQLEIYNRWGEVVFETEDLHAGWDGTYRSSTEVAQDGVYTWVVRFKDLTNQKHSMNGHVSLLK